VSVAQIKLDYSRKEEQWLESKKEGLLAIYKDRDEKATQWHSFLARSFGSLIWLARHLGYMEMEAGSQCW